MTKEQWYDFVVANLENFKKNRRYEYGIREMAEKYFHLEHHNHPFNTGSGASKRAIVENNGKYVIKWTKDNTYGEDESLRECENYIHAQELGIECFFPKTEILYRDDDIVIVIQQKVEFALGNMRYDKLQKIVEKHKTVSDKVVGKAGKSFYEKRRSPNSQWLRVAISYYGKNKMKTLCHFTKLYKINDLHDYNVGFLKDNRPVILDFSGYYRY